MTKNSTVKITPVDLSLFLSLWKVNLGLAVREALALGVRVIQINSGGTIEHGAVALDDLIPIGAGPEILRRRLEAALESHPSHPAPLPVCSFDNQARAFEELAADTLTKNKVQ